MRAPQPTAYCSKSRLLNSKKRRISLRQTLRKRSKRWISSNANSRLERIADWRRVPLQFLLTSCAKLRPSNAPLLKFRFSRKP